MADGFSFFDQIFLLRFTGEGPAHPAWQERLRALGIAERSQLLRADPRLVEPRVILALTHRAALQQALDSGAPHALVLEEGCLLHRDSAQLLAPALAALAIHDWRIVAFGGAAEAGGLVPVTDAPSLLQGTFEGCFAVAYAAAALPALLATMPAEPPLMADWIATQESFDGYLATLPGRFLLTSRVASLPHLLPYEDPALRDGFLP